METRIEIKTNGWPLVSHLPMHMHNSHLTHFDKNITIHLYICQVQCRSLQLPLFQTILKTMQDYRTQKSNRKLNVIIGCVSSRFKYTRHFTQQLLVTQMRNYTGNTWGNRDFAPSRNTIGSHLQRGFKEVIVVSGCSLSVNLLTLLGMTLMQRNLLVLTVLSF